MHPRIDLVTLTSKIATDFGQESAALFTGSVGVANYEVDLARIKSALARFLANNISTTSTHDSGSRVLLVHGDSCGEQRANELILSPIGQINDELRQASLLGPSALADTLLALAEKIRAAESPDSWSALRTSLFRWPVFGSQGASINTPEGYFDACATMIRMSGCVPVAVGALHARAPVSLLKTLAKTDIKILLARFDLDESRRQAGPITPIRARGHLRLIG